MADTLTNAAMYWHCAALQALMQDQESSGALRARAGQVITALGGTLPEGTSG